MIMNLEIGRVYWITQVGSVYSNKGPHKQKREAGESERESEKETEVRVIQGHEPSNAGGLENLVKARKWILP